MLFSRIEPIEVFEQFEKIASIPHGSGNCAGLASYCMDYARAHGHETYQDAAGNVMIFAKGSEGYEDRDPVILQGHLDMVCDQLPECSLDMETEGLDLCSDGEFLWADSTTLGADDGIAIAYILAILGSDSIPHPPIEALFTVEEEVGMIGARNLDSSRLKGKRLISLDSEIEGELIVSCAGSTRAKVCYPFAMTEPEQSSYVFYSMAVSGLAGGHSGIDIHKNPVNGIKVLADILWKLSESYSFHIASFDGGSKVNAIPKNAKAVICVERARLAEICDKVEEIAQKIKEEYEGDTKGMRVAFVPSPRHKMVASVEAGLSLLQFVQELPSGVFKMNEEIYGMVESSLNLGVIKTEEDQIVMSYLIRSNASDDAEHGRDDMKATLLRVANEYHASVEYGPESGAWIYQQDSKLRELLIDVYKKCYGEDPKVGTVHAGLECGILSAKMPGVDFISFGPTMHYVHTPKEKLDIASAQRCWRFLLEILKEMP